MSLIDGKEIGAGLDATLADPLVNRVRDELIPALQTAVAVSVDRAAAQLSNIVAAALQGIQATEDKAATDVRGLLAGLDGWTLEITVPPITIRLTAPKSGKP